jgi:signal transduction histidine kinase
MESNFRNSVIDSLLQQEDIAKPKKLLQSAEKESPAFKNLMFIGNNGELFTSMVILGTNKASSSKNQLTRELRRVISEAENAEFIEKNHSGAINSYRKALIHTTSPGEKAMLYAGIGRNYFKSHQYENGILEYKKILELGEESLYIGTVPASIVALHQIAKGYKEISAFQDQKSILIELYLHLLDHPWDLSGGEYLFYLKSTRAEIREIESSNTSGNTNKSISNEMRSREEELLEQAQYIHLIEGEILEEILSDLERMTSSETRHKWFTSEPGPDIRLNYFRLPPSIQHTQLKAMVFQFDEAYILTELFPRVLSSVGLGKDVAVGILNNNDSLLFIQSDLQLSSYLVTGNFTQIFVSWQVALFDTRGKSIEQLAGREKHLYLALFIGILAVMLVGFIVLARAVVHETEISRLKSEFVSNVTHELKTPLSLIRMFGETLESGIVTDEGKQKEFYSIIRKESERLTHLINNVLDFSSLDSGNKEYENEETDLVATIRHSLEAYKFHIRDRGFEIESNMPEGPVMVLMDKDAISQAFLNLLSNAVKYSKERKYIGVEISRGIDSVLISVTDHGIGIAKGELKKIFDKFYRVPNPGVKQARGSGLGLTLSMHIMEAHGGTIEVESEAGKGSRFTLRLPVQ